MSCIYRSLAFKNACNPASLFSGCYRTGSAKITMGTGSFLDVVTESPHASLNGLIRLVAWRIPRY